VTPTTARTALRLALIATVAASMSACASRPKPAGPAPATQAPPPPSQPAPSTGAVGESVIPGSERDFVINAGDRVYFDFDSYEVRVDAKPVLEAQAAWLKRYPAVKVRIEGNTDERGTREYNIALGARRANAVRDLLVGQGVGGDRIATVSYGKEQPIDAGSGEEAWARNRNAHTTIVSGAR
jgi:peptidoglycan-associated lipoprotein